MVFSVLKNEKVIKNFENNFNANVWLLYSRKYWNIYDIGTY